MPPPLGLVNLSAGELIAAAGGDPWQINDGLQAGDAGAINAQADAFHAAAGSATEVDDDFRSAKQRFEKGWRHNGTEQPINESAEVTRVTTDLKLQKPQLAKIALDLEMVAAALATAQRTCDADIAALDNFLHGIDDQIGAAKSDNQDTQALHDAAVGAVTTALGDIKASRDGYVATMTSAKASIAAATAGTPQGADGGAGAAGGANPPPAAQGADGRAADHPSPMTVTGGDVALGSAGAVAGVTVDGVRQAVLDAIAKSPGTGPGKADPWLLKWFEDPKIGGVELNGFSRVGGVVAAAGAVPAVMSDIHDGNSVAEAVTREGAGTAVGLGLGALAGDAAAGAAIGSVVPGAGTAVGLVVGTAVGAGAALLASKGVEMAWHPVADAVGSAVRGVESVFGFG